MKHYIDWAAKEGFGIIDVNVPKHLSGIGVCVYLFNFGAVTKSLDRKRARVMQAVQAS